MQITVSKPDLETALQVASIGISSSGADLSTHYLFRAKDQKVEVLAHNNHICTSAPLNCQHDEEGAFTIEGWRLTRWLSGVPDVAMTFTLGKGEVTATVPRGNIRFRSLDASKFPFWDGTLAGSEVTAKVKGDRLADALGYARHFVSDTDTTHPEISQVEVVLGCLWATDKKAVTLITVKGLEKSAFRIHGKNLGALLKFLSLRKGEDVEVLEHARTAFFRRGDGSVFGVARPLAAFPKLNVSKDETDDAEWEVKNDDLRSTTQCLSASAEKDSTGMHFSYRSDDSMILLSVESVAGGSDEMPIPCTLQREASKFEDGFDLDYEYLTHIADYFKQERLRFGISRRGNKGGFVRFNHEVDTDSYMTVVVWRMR